jgi:hypothetical protein
MKLDPPYYPIIYVRGFAATMSEIDNTSATPYMGFNLGSTKIRQDYQGKPVKFIFESPLIRLIKDFGYSETYHHGDVIDEDYMQKQKDAGKQDQLKRSIWVFRYYDAVASDFSDGKRLRIPEFARMLRDYILQIRSLLCDTKEEKDDFKVYLVAHSMGGLICRCYLQNIMKGKQHFVDKVFTYATPHNGIDMLGMNVPDIGFIDGLHNDNFNRKRMRDYLKIEEPGKEANSIEDAFPIEKFFCFIGSNYKDYDAFFGMSKRGTGRMSDGLVMIENAYVKGAARAFAHRSHSGHYGIVNSEEGFQNLTRFLFGSFKITISLETYDITLPTAVAEKICKDGTIDFKRLNASYYIETAAMVRTEKHYINERRLHQESAIRKEYDDLRNKPTYLFTGFLHGLTNTVDGRANFAIQLAIKTPVYEIDKKFWFNSYYEGNDLLNETVIISLKADDPNPVKYQTSTMTQPKPLKPDPANPGELRIPLQNTRVKVDVPEDKKPPEAFWGALVLKIEEWNV